MRTSLRRSAMHSLSASTGERFWRAKNRAACRATVGQDSVAPTFERSEANGVSILPRDARGARTTCGGSIGSTESRPTQTKRTAKLVTQLAPAVGGTLLINDLAGLPAVVVNSSPVSGGRGVA